VVSVVYANSQLSCSLTLNNKAVTSDVCALRVLPVVIKYVRNVYRME